MWEYFIVILYAIGLNGSKLKLPDVQPNEPISPHGPIVINISSKDEVAKSIDSLHSQFSDLTTEIRNGFDKLIAEGEVELLGIARNAGDYLRIPVESLKTESVDEFFDHLQPHYDFFNFSVLKHLVSKYLRKNRLNSKLNQYARRVDKFAKSSQLKHIRSVIKQKLLSLPTTSSGSALKVVIKLNERWEDMTLENFNKVLKHYFGSTSDLFSHIDIDYSSVMVKMLIPVSVSQEFIDKVIAKKVFMSRLGIYEVVIDGEIIFSQEDDNNFDQSLHQSVEADNRFEVSKLMELGADPHGIDEKIMDFAAKFECTRYDFQIRNIFK